MKIAVTGARGLLGRAVVASAAARGHHVIAWTRQHFDITNRSATLRAIALDSPDAVIHCAAFCDVDRCETEAALAYSVNATGAGMIAEGAYAVGALLLHISSDYVFEGNGDEPIPEDSVRCPRTVYGSSKAEGEDRVRAAHPDATIVRTQWLFGPGGRDFVSTMRRRAEEPGTIEVVDDQWGRPTCTSTLAPALVELAASPVKGTLHIACEGIATWFDLADELFRIENRSVDLQRTDSQRYVRPAPRPRHSVLDTSKWTKLGRTALPHWKSALFEHVQDRSNGLPQ